MKLNDRLNKFEVCSKLGETSSKIKIMVVKLN